MRILVEEVTHTWDLYVHYDRCPYCGKIVEIRKRPIEQMGKVRVLFVCDRCLKKAERIKEKEPAFGPLIGERQQVEFDWS